MSRNQQLESLACDEIMKRISAHQGVIGFGIFDANGLAIKSNLKETETILLGGLIGDVIGRSNEVAKALGGHFSTIRIHTMKCQVSITIERDFRILTVYKLESEQAEEEDEEQQAKQ